MFLDNTTISATPRSRAQPCCVRGLLVCTNYAHSININVGEFAGVTPSAPPKVERRQIHAANRPLQKLLHLLLLRLHAKNLAPTATLCCVGQLPLFHQRSLWPTKHLVSAFASNRAVGCWSLARHFRFAMENRELLTSFSKSNGTPG